MYQSSETSMAPVPPSRLAWPAWCYTLAMGAAATALTAALVSRFAARTLSPLPLVVLATMFLFAEVLRIDLPSGDGYVPLTMSGAALTVALAYGRPVHVVIGATIGAGAHSLIRRRPPVNTMFAVTRAGLATAIAVLLFFAMRPDRRPNAPTLWAAIIACAEAAVIVAITTAGMRRMLDGEVEVRETLRRMVISVVTTTATASIGVQAIALERRSPWLLPLVVVPVTLVLWAFRAYANDQRSWTRHEFIHQATAALHQDRNLDDGMEQVLSQIRVALQAEFTQVVLFSANGTLAVIAHDDDEKSQRLSEPASEIVDASWVLAQRLSGPTIINATASSREFLTTLGVEQGIAVPLFHERRLAGLLVVANRSVNAPAFGKEERSLVALVGQQIEVAIERGWLQQSLRQLIDLERQLAHQAHHDGLTSLANRRRFNERLEELLPTDGTPQHGALLMIDLDGFKYVNDAHGHDAGDQLLTAIGRRMGLLIRNGDLVARIGGDEFGVILAGVSDLSTAASRAERIIDAIEQPAQIRDYEIRISASVGIALVDDCTISPAELIRNADLALYHAKTIGKGRFALYDPQMRSAAEERRMLVFELEQAIARHEFEVLYQPIHDIVSGNLLGAEALIRWQHPQRGRLSPAAFMEVAEQTGLIAPIGEQMLDLALSTAAGWVATLDPDQAFTLNVNLSARQLRDPGVGNVVHSALVRAGFDPRRLVVEITESSLIDDIEGTKEIVEQLNRLGTQVALDDFGTGYSSLSHVRAFPLHHLKIDKSFVGSMTTSATNAAVVGSIVHLAAALGVVAVAEGIETPEQLAELRRRGCRVGQGYLMSEPLEPATFGQLLRSHRTTNWLVTGPAAAN